MEVDTSSDATCITFTGMVSFVVVDSISFFSPHDINKTVIEHIVKT
jgi:hypothetical protein